MSLELLRLSITKLKFFKDNFQVKIDKPHNHYEYISGIIYPTSSKYDSTMYGQMYQSY